MASVVTPKSFYVKARRDYSNWRFAFWRENFQNSVDAGCSSIDISMNDLGNGSISVVFDDNGKGMSRDILENVYFRLGESTKGGSSSVGGFGLARILTCFSMKNYKITTQDNLVVGDGGEYSISDVEFFNGCKLEVEIENESLGSMNDALSEYLRQSQLPCRVTVNGERWTKWCYRRTLTRQLSLDDNIFANVYVNKSGENGLLMIRVNGTIMYSQRTRAKAQVIVEIVPEIARDVLTAHRDGMTYKYQYVLNSFIQELSVDTTSALKSRFTNKSAVVLGQGMFSSRKKNTANNQKDMAESNQDLAVGSASDLCHASVGSIPIAEFTNKDEGAYTVSADYVAGYRKVIGEKFLNDLPNIYIDDETESADVHSVINQYHPENWIVKEVGGKTYNKGNKFYKLLMLWKIACQHAIDALMDFHPTTDHIVWGLGWVFSEQVRARCRSVSAGSVFLLNPVDEKGKVRFSLRDKKDLKVLMALAKHEVAHVIYSYHDESYASLLTGIDENFDEKKAYQSMAAFLA